MTPTFGPGNTCIGPTLTDPLSLTASQQQQQTGPNTIPVDPIDGKLIDVCLTLENVPSGMTGNYTVWYNFGICNAEPNTPIVTPVYQGCYLAGDSNGAGFSTLTFEWPNKQPFWVKSWYEVDYDNGQGGFQPVGAQPTVFTDTPSVADPAPNFPVPPDVQLLDTASVHAGS